MLAARLEQFHDAFGLLAGAQSVSSPPITVMAFPDQAAMDPFLPLYQGKPANLAGFFKRNSEENLIVLALSGTNTGSMQVIFHEYTHFLFRRNARLWPIWLQEGMADMYSTFDAAGRGVRIGKPLEEYLQLLAHSEMMPLHELLAVTHDSPQYNEADRQGVFYAESWLLTHFLMNGDNPSLKARFRQFTPLLQKGLSQEKAFTTALGTPLSTIEAELHRYLERNQFESLPIVVPVDLNAPRQVAMRPIGVVETRFRLGNELMRIDRLEAAESQFKEALKLAPQSPLPYEGLGLLAAEREKPEESVHQLNEAFARGATSYLANYTYAQQRFHMTSDGHDKYTRLKQDLADEIRAKLNRVIGMMPSFAPAHELLGFLELVQGDDPGAAEQHFLKAIQLDTENQWYLLSLAQAQIMKKDPTAARHTLAALHEPQVDAKLRAQADEVLKEIDDSEKRARN